MMTESEKKLMDLVLSGQSISDYTTRFNELRNAVLFERLPPEKKAVWQEAYRQLRLARINLDQVSVDLGVSNLTLTPWKKEVDEEVP